MDNDKLLIEAKRIAESPNSVAGQTMMAQAMEMVRNYAGPTSSFYRLLENASKGNPNLAVYRDAVIDTMKGFIQYVQSGLFQGLSPKREAQIEVVSDFLDQANTLLDDPKVHPAGAAVLIGASLEEFLRNWVESEKLELKDRKPGIDSYASILREKEAISKQDVKDITSWAGLRNHAAHGEWEYVQNREQVALMLQGVNLFMRKASKT
jgi:hypothetical protein